MSEYELYHHGVKGQKWGVIRDRKKLKRLKEQRTQHELKKLAAEDPSKYEDKLVEKVLKKHSYLWTPEAMRELDKSMQAEASRRAEVWVKENTDRAKKILSDAKQREPQITKDVTDSVAKNSAKMYGMKNRLKTEESILRKVTSKEVNDAVRYTAILSDKDFVSQYQNIKNDLTSKGYSETKCKNYFQQYQDGKVNHKAVQCNYQTPDGYTFEIQFHTKSSQKAKNKKVPLYEEARDSKTSDERKKELDSKMRKLADKVQDPPNISEIIEHGYTTMNEYELYHHGVKGQKWGVRRDKYLAKMAKNNAKIAENQKLLNTVGAKRRAERTAQYQRVADRYARKASKARMRLARGKSLNAFQQRALIKSERANAKVAKYSKQNDKYESKIATLNHKNARLQRKVDRLNKKIADEPIRAAKTQKRIEQGKKVIEALQREAIWQDTVKRHGVGAALVIDQQLYGAK